MERIKVILTSIVTWITIAQAVLLILSDEIGDLFPDGSAQSVVTVIIRIIAVLGAVINIIRRVTPVMSTQRGLLLPRGASTNLKIPVRDRGESMFVIFAVVILAVIVAIILINLLGGNDDDVGRVAGALGFY